MATWGSAPQPLLSGQSWRLAAKAGSSAFRREHRRAKVTGLSFLDAVHLSAIPIPMASPGSPLLPQGLGTWPLRPHPLVPLPSAPWMGEWVEVTWVRDSWHLHTSAVELRSTLGTPFPE